VTTFLATAENAVLTLLWIALCVDLVLAWLKFRSKFMQSMQQILRILQMNLFECRGLDTLFNPHQFTPNPQLALL